MNGFQNAKLGRWPANDQRVLPFNEFIPEGSLTIGSHSRLFASFSIREGDGQTTAGRAQASTEDQGDFHEAFLDISTGLDENPVGGRLRLGEAGNSFMGPAGSLTTTRGVNVKSSFLRGENHRHNGAVFVLKFLWASSQTEQNTGNIRRSSDFSADVLGSLRYRGRYGLIDKNGEADLLLPRIRPQRAQCISKAVAEKIRHSIGDAAIQSPAWRAFRTYLGFDYKLGVGVPARLVSGRNYINAWTVRDRNGFSLSQCGSCPGSPYGRILLAEGQHPNGGTLKHVQSPVFLAAAYFGPKLTMFGALQFVSTYIRY